MPSDVKEATKESSRVGSSRPLTRVSTILETETSAELSAREHQDPMKGGNSTKVTEATTVDKSTDSIAKGDRKKSK